MPANIRYAVFTKPWPHLSIPKLGELVSKLGFDGIELPVRPGFQVEPENVAALPKAMKELARFGVAITSVAAPADEVTIEACAEAGVPTIRVMAPIEEGEPYPKAESRLRREYDALVPLLEKHEVQLGVQNHCGRFMMHAVSLRELVKNYDPRFIAIVWDAAHEALNGGLPDLALDVVWPHLCMVNLKNAIWQRANGPEAEVAEYSIYWTSGRQGLANWPRVIKELKQRQYTGVVCLTAEYSDHTAVNRLIAEDLVFARDLFDQAV